MKFYAVTVLFIYFCCLFQTVKGCGGFIFVGQDSQCTCPQNYVFLNSILYISSYLSNNTNNLFALRDFGSIAEWQKIQFSNKTIFEKQIKQWMFYDLNGRHCIYDSSVYFTELLQDILNQVKQPNYNYGIFIQAETDTIKDLNRALPFAAQIASYNPNIYIWDHSVNGDQTGMFSILTNQMYGHIFRSSTDLQQLVNAINLKLIPDFQSIACGNSPPISSNPIAPIAVPTTTSTTTPIPTTISLPDLNCNNFELIFLLDRSQSILMDYYNYNTVQFVLDLANKYIFPGENSTDFVRFGVIQFSDDSVVSIPLGNWSRSEFEYEVRTNIFYDNGGIIITGTPLTSEILAITWAVDAFITAFSQFQQNSIFKNRAIVLIVNDISTFSIGDSINALTQLKQYVNLPMGAIVPGLWGTPEDALSHLIYLFGNQTQLAFGSLNSAINGIPTLIHEKFPCPTKQPCSALIFIEEATEAIGHPNKLQFLQLIQKLAASTAMKENQRFSIALYGNGIFHRTELQTFNVFNQTLTAFIDSVQTSDSPNAGQTRLAPILTDLKNVINSGTVQNYTILLMGELE
uniref:VWFA domain-containing protein n=1 Tax=Panagrolaimus sp. PS1159 TaxID=55785 RepID=A0AC35FLE0_9BILA